MDPKENYEKMRSALDDLGAGICEKMSNDQNGVQNMMESLALNETNIAKKNELLEKISEGKELERIAEMQLQNKAMMAMRGQYQNTESSSDGDQTPLKGNALVVLKYQWASGMDISPENPRLSQWMKSLFLGDYPAVLKMIEKTKEKDLNELIEKRESLYNIGAIFHVIIGARSLCGNRKEFAEFRKSFKNDKSDHMACFNKLLELGVKVNTKDFAGYTPLHHCTTKFANDETKKMAKILLKKGANVNEQNRFGATPLMEPTMNGHLDVLEFLIKYGADPSIPDNDGITCGGFNTYPKIQEIFWKASIKNSKTKKNEAKEEKGGCLWKCEGCGSSDKDNKRCTACYLVWYCGKSCQENDWKNHKDACKQTRKKFVPVKIEREKIMTTKNLQTGGVYVCKATDVPSSKHFLVKIQVPQGLNGGKSLVYNKDRTFMGWISPSDGSLKKLTEQIREKGPLGAKGFFYAIWKEDGLKINTTDMQAAQTW